MRLVKRVPAAQMILERFDDYYQPDKRVNFTQFDLRLVPEEATRVAALRAGEGDIAPVTLEVWPGTPIPPKPSFS